MNLIVRIERVYGIAQVYPVSKEAKLLARIAGTKTLTPNVLKAIKDLGYTIEVERPAIV